MRKIFLSFLGTNDYLTCTYFGKGIEPVENVRFIQEATLSAYCRHWNEWDQGFIFVTKGSKSMNWVDNGQQKRLEEKGICEGLESRISKLKLPFPIEPVEIPEGFTEEQIWEIFQIVFDRLESQDNVLFDITHAFRSIPVLAMVVLNYARVLKNISIKGIYYGAFEALGTTSEVKEKPLAERRAEILDITALETLLAWSGAIDGFLKSGNARQIKALAAEEFGTIRKNDPDSRAVAASFEKLASSISTFCDAITTCRGPQIPWVTNQVQQKLAEVQAILEQPTEVAMGRAFRPLFDHLQGEVEAFRGAPINGGIQAAQWCLEHGLIQQGYTILQETLITFFVKKIGADPLDKKARELVPSAAKIVNENLSRDHWRGESAKPENGDRVEHLRGVFRDDKEILKLFSRLSQERNDLNHAGYSGDKKDSKKFFSNLDEHIKKAVLFLDRKDKG